MITGIGDANDAALMDTDHSLAVMTIEFEVLAAVVRDAGDGGIGVRR